MGQLRSKSTSRPIKPLLARWDMCGIARSLRLAAYPTHRRTHLIIFAACARSGQHKTSSTLACRSYTPIDPESVCCNEWCYRTGTYDTYLAACFFFRCNTSPSNLRQPRNTSARGPSESFFSPSRSDVYSPLSRPVAAPGCAIGEKRTAEDAHPQSPKSSEEIVMEFRNPVAYGIVPCLCPCLHVSMYIYG